MIHVENLWKTFRRHDALRGLSFNVEPGSAMALIGANGAGKTTTLKILMNIMEPTRGHVRILGVDSRRISPKELSQIGYVAESQEFPGALTVAEYVDYIRPFYPTWDRDLETSVRRQLDLPPKRRIRDLSHGMRMKMALACALPFHPKLLILDEPFSGLDLLVREELMQGLLGQADEMTVLISSHELDEIAGMTTDVAFIEEGRLLFQESMGGLADRFREVRVTLDRDATLPIANPNGWMNIQAVGSVLTFVDGHYSERELGERVRKQIDGVRNIDAEAMTLRSIFTTLTRHARTKRPAENGEL
jgi:ABC-2 type transport system ATP-binding protein